MGARLMEPKTQPQFNNLLKFARKVEEHIWLGGSDIQEVGVWRWLSDGSLIDEERKFWAENEPESVRHDCLILWYGAGLGDALHVQAVAISFVNMTINILVYTSLLIKY